MNARVLSSVPQVVQQARYTLLSLTGLVAGLAILLIPIFGSQTMVDFTFRTCSLLILAMSWNLMASAGLISLGHSAFFGLGSYAGILTANLLGVPFWLSLAVAVVAGGVLGLCLAVVTAQLRGIFFSVTTLALSEGLRIMAVMLPGGTGGSKGAYLAASTVPSQMTVNFAMSVAAVLSCLCAILVFRSRYYYALRAMRANEHAAQMIGIFPLKYRVGITVISGAMASLVGGVEVWHSGYLDPGIAFDLHITIMAQIAPIIGGLYTVGGPIIGAVLTIFLGDTTRLALGHIPGASLFVFGLLLVGCVLYLPYGLVGLFMRFARSSATVSEKNKEATR